MEAILNSSSANACQKNRLRNLRRWGSLTITVSAGVLAFALAAFPQTSTTAAAKPKTGTTSAAAKPATTPGKLTPAVKSYGSKNAPIMLEVFSDYECPSCRAFFETTLRTMISDYVNSGKVYLLHHDYPLPMHMYSGMAARWGAAAAHVGEFQNVEAALYDNQPSWETNGDIAKYVAAAMSADEFKKVQAQMKGCEGPGPTAGTTGTVTYPAGGKPCPLDNEIAQDIALGTKVPVQATPTFVITYKGKRMAPGSGVVSWPILKQFFDSLQNQ